MDIAYAALRLVHVASAVFWVGSSVTMLVFVEPAARATAPEGWRVLQQMARRGLPLAVNAAGLLTVVAGALLYARASDGFQATAWLATPTGRAFGLGGAAGILALVVGWAAALTRARWLSTISLALLTIALGLMVIARAL